MNCLQTEVKRGPMGSAVTQSGSLFEWRPLEPTFHRPLVRPGERWSLIIASS